MVKLNIEMSMASLITKLAKGTIEDRNNEFMIQSSSHNHSHGTQPTAIGMKSGVHSSASGKKGAHSSHNSDKEFQGIRTLKEVNIKVERIPEEYQGSLSDSGLEDGFDSRKNGPMHRAGARSDDELPLAPPNLPPKTPQG